MARRTPTRRYRSMTSSRWVKCAERPVLWRLSAVIGEDAYLADMDAELGPVPQHELKAAREWADRVLPAGRGGSARQARSA